MRSKLNFLISNSINKKVKSKWFLVANLIIAILIIGIINIDSIITLFGGDFDSKTKVYVMDQTNSIYEPFKANLHEFEKNLYGEDKKVYSVKKFKGTEKEAKKLIEEKEKSAILINLYYNSKHDLEANLISLTTIDTYDYQLISTSLTSTANLYTLSSIGLTEEQYNKIVKGIDIKREILDDKVTSEDENVEMIMTTAFPIVILPFFMLTIFLVQSIGSEVNDEKSTKSMEIIISNVSPKTHFLAKVISNNLFIISQLILTLLYGGVGLFIRKLVGGNSIVNGVGDEVAKSIKTLTTGALGDKLVVVLIFTVILMLITFIAYSLVAGILASMTTNTEDYQQVQVPIVIVLLLGYYLSIMAGMFKGSLFIKVFSFLPFISAILSPSLLVLGQIGIVEIIISCIIMILTVFVLVKYGLRIYKVGILNYSSTGMWKKMFKSIKGK